MVWKKNSLGHILEKWGVFFLGFCNTIFCRSTSQHLITNPVQSALPSNKRQRAKHFLNIFGSAWPWDLRGPGPYSNFLQSPLMIDLWMEEGQILMIFPYFSWKCRRSSTQEYALNTHTSCFLGCSPHVCLKKYMDSLDVIFLLPKIALSWRLWTWCHQSLM